MRVAAKVRVVSISNMVLTYQLYASLFTIMASVRALKFRHMNRAITMRLPFFERVRARLLGAFNSVPAASVCSIGS